MIPKQESQTYKVSSGVLNSVHMFFTRQAEHTAVLVVHFVAVFSLSFTVEYVL